MLLITGVANRRFMTVFLWVAFVLFFLTFLFSLVTAMVFAVGETGTLRGGLYCKIPQSADRGLCRIRTYDPLLVREVL